MKLQSNKVTHIQYEKLTKDGSTGEITERYVIPTFVPLPNVKALDVTDLSEDERAYVEETYAEYSEYVATQMKTIATFENWLEQSRQDVDTPSKIKWRTFRTSNIQLLED